MTGDDESEPVRDVVAEAESMMAEEAARQRAIAPPSRPPRATNGDAKGSYAQAALRREREAVAQAIKGQRESTVNTALLALGRHVAAGHLNENEVRREIESACYVNRFIQDDYGGNAERFWTLKGDRSLRHGMNQARDYTKVGNDAAPNANVIEVDDFSVGPRRKRRKAKPEPEQEGSDRQVHIKFLSGMKSRAPLWVWSFDGVGVVQLGRMILFAGSTGAGKSTATRWFAAQVSNGTLPGAWHGQPMKVALFCGEEDTETQVMASLDAHGADRSNVATVFTTERDDIGGLQILQDETRLIKELVDNEIRVLIVDPVMDTLNHGADPNSQLDVRSVLAAYSRIALAINGLVVGVAHLRKPNTMSGRVRDEITGSRAWVEKVRHTITFASMPGESRRLMQVTKNSAGEEDVTWFYKLPVEEVVDDYGKAHSTIRFEPQTRSPYTIDEMGAGGDDSDLFLVHVEWLRMYLEHNGPRPSVDVKRDAAKEMSVSTLHRVRRKIKCEVRYRTEEGITKTWWGLPGAFWNE